MATNVQDVIMLFGDSITQGGWQPDMDGFGQRLSHVYARKLDVLNRGLSGYNTEWALPIFRRCLATKDVQPTAPNIRILTIWFGANDACIEPSPQHVPIEKFTSNMKEFVNIVQSPNSPYHSPSTRIILIAPPPVNTYQRKAELDTRDPPVALDRHFLTTKLYADAVRRVAQDTGVTFVDVWTLIWEAAGQDERSLSKYLVDGLHLNGEGYRLMYDALIAAIAKEHPDVYFDNLPFVFPPWIDHVPEAERFN